MPVTKYHATRTCSGDERYEDHRSLDDIHVQLGMETLIEKFPPFLDILSKRCLR